MAWAYEQSEKAIKFINEGNQIPFNIGQKIVECINTGNKDLVAELDSRYGVL
jgi:hypothetical protein